jgi:hypothetical protein
MGKLFAVSDSVAVDQCEDRLRQLFDHIATERLGRVDRPPGPYINGENISLEDIALCSLAGPVLLPDTYCEGKFYKWFRALEKGDPDTRNKIEHFRNTVTGKYVLNFYAKHRMCTDR